MKRILLSIGLATVITACEGTTDPFGGVGGGGGGSGAITQAQASGDWSMTLRRTTTLSCSGGSLPENQILLLHLDVTNTGGLTTATSTWRASPSATVRALAGTVNFTTGVTNLTLFASATNTTSGMELSGTLTAAGAFSGTVVDPAAGLTPVFSGNGCEYTATGVKTG
jgi:hypothetical protein